jgi:hypothetical protein
VEMKETGPRNRSCNREKNLIKRRLRRRCAREGPVDGRGSVDRQKSDLSGRLGDARGGLSHGLRGRLLRGASDPSFFFPACARRSGLRTRSGLFAGSGEDVEQTKTAFRRLFEEDADTREKLAAFARQIG